MAGGLIDRNHNQSPNTDTDTITNQQQAIFRSNQYMVVILRVMMLVEIPRKALMIHTKRSLPYYGSVRIFLSLSFFEKSFSRLLLYLEHT